MVYWRKVVRLNTIKFRNVVRQDLRRGGRFTLGLHEKIHEKLLEDNSDIYYNKYVMLIEKKDRAESLRVEINQPPREFGRLFPGVSS